MSINMDTDIALRLRTEVAAWERVAPKLADWRCARCGRLLLRHGPNPGAIEIKCHSCRRINRRGLDV